MRPLLAAAECRFRGEPAIELRDGPVRAVFVPQVGMTGVSLRGHGREHLALPGGLDAFRAGHTGGLPLLAPWANRLATMRYRAAGRTVDLSGLGVPTDGAGLPIHGLLVGQPGWRIERLGVTRGTASVRAALDVDAPAFPFPHRVEIEAAVGEDRLQITTTVVATGRRRVPVAFGWHPYLRVPGSPRHTWRLRLPRREHVQLDARGIPTGARTPSPPEAAPIDRRTFDDLYALGARRVCALEAPDGAAVEVRPDHAYGYTQVWVPPGRPFAALEPMTVAVDALRTGAVPLVAPGESFAARFTIVIRAADTRAAT